MPAPDLISGFYSTGGTLLGVTITGYVFVPYTQGGIVMQDSSGALWLLQVGTDGRLSADTFTR